MVSATANKSRESIKGLGRSGSAAASVNDEWVIDCVSRNAHQATAEAVLCSKGKFHRHHDPPSIHEPAEVAIIGSYGMCSPGVRSLGGFNPEAGCYL
jgi:hypothetical protein